MTVRSVSLGLATSVLLASSALAQTPLKIGFITTLSGPAGYLGQDIRDAFQLFIESNGGKLGGVPVQVMVEDDNMKPGQGKQIAERLMKDEKVKLLTGIVFSNVLAAVAPDILENKGIYVSPNAAPSSFAGKGCHRNYYVVSWQNDSPHESAGENANKLGYKRVFILAPNYAGGKDSLSGFKRRFKGAIAGEVYTRLDQTDFAPEMAQIKAANPDAVFQFHPGGLGIAFQRQYQQAGLLGKIPMIVAGPSMDQVIMKTIGDAAMGVNVSAQWNSDFDNVANKKFVSGWNKKYNRPVTLYASQGYDAAQAIDAALKQTGGKVDDTEAFRTAMLKANFPSVRGNFKFGANQHPVQSWYSMVVEKGTDGRPALKTKSEILASVGDAYASECKM